MVAEGRTKIECLWGLRVLRRTKEGHRWSRENFQSSKQRRPG